MKTSTIATALTLGLATAQGAWAADKFPERPVKIINPFPAGSGPDAVARLIGGKLGKAWGQPLVIENRPGGNGFIAMERLRRASFGSGLARILPRLTFAYSVWARTFIASSACVAVIHAMAPSH